VSAQLAKTIRTERKRAGLSIRALGKKLVPTNPEVGRRSIYRWESGKTTPTQSSLDALAEALEIPRETFTANGKEAS